MIQFLRGMHRQPIYHIGILVVIMPKTFEFPDHNYNFVSTVCSFLIEKKQQYMSVYSIATLGTNVQKGGNKYMLNK